MAWYDYFFNCDIVPLKKGYLKGITGNLKPSSHVKDKQEGVQSSDFKARNIIIYLSHILFIVPILGYIAIYKKKINPITYPLLGVISLFTAGYHGVSLMTGSHH